MLYDFELMIGGLCMLSFDALPDPEECQVLLVNATRPIDLLKNAPSLERPYLHQPRLTVSGRHLSHDPGIRLPDRSVTGPTGEDFGVYEIDLEQLTLTANGAADLGVGLGRRAGNHATPGETGALLKWLDWTCGPAGSSFQDSRILGLHPDCFTAPTKTGRVIASLTTRIGALETFAVGKKAALDRLFKFEPWGGGTNPPGPFPRHSLADRLRIRIEGISRQDRVVIQSSEGDIVLGPETGTPGRPLVRAALTNLHETYYAPREQVYDFAWFYSMVEWDQGVPLFTSLIIPSSVEGHFTPSSGLCPPAFWG